MNFPAAPELAGTAVTAWSRRHGNWGTISPLPPEGRFATVAVRLPRAREELDMLLHLAADRLVPGGSLYMTGANDEGIKSVPDRIEPLFGPPETVLVKYHCRVFRAFCPETMPPLKTHLQDWRMEFTLPLPGEEKHWVSYPGVFAHGRLDEGTALLLSVLEQLPQQRRVLDYAC
ncbi:MAG: methyltransferase, partial [Pseudomonadota bacterium]|nr:methyltransferase [Pseudomonadota bacterium]